MKTALTFLVFFAARAAAADITLTGCTVKLPVQGVGSPTPAPVTDAPATSAPATSAPAPGCSVRQVQDHTGYQCQQETISLNSPATNGASCFILSTTEAECRAHHVNSKPTSSTLGTGASSACTMFYTAYNWCVVACDSVTDAQCCSGLTGVTTVTNGQAGYNPGQPWQMASSSPGYSTNSWTWETCSG